jgi:hypothetical protein
MFQVNNLRPRSSASLRLISPVSTIYDDDDEFDVSHTSDVCIKSLQGRRGKYLLLFI